MFVFAAAAAALVFQLRIILAPPQTQVRYLPDDGYYYLSLARNFVRLGYWTLDRGLSVTSGFHPLWAWLSAALYGAVTPGPDAFVGWAAASGVAVTWLGVGLLWSGARPKLGWPALMAGALVWASPNALLQSVSCMEWPWVVLAAVLYWRLGARGGSGRLDGLGLFMVGTLGSLARTDFGLFPAAWFLAVAVARLRGRATQPWLPLAFGLAGAVAGVLLALAHNAAYTGTAMQFSGLVKQYWASHGDRALSHPFTVLFSLFPGGLTRVGKPLAGIPLLALAADGLLSRGPLLRRWLCSGRPLSASAAALEASVLALAGYLLVYAASAEVNLWYSANLVVPAFLSGTALFTLARRRRKLVLAAAWIFLAANTWLLASPRAVPYPTQARDLAVGRTLAPKPGERWGAWDCGIAAYYSDCGLMNLDGLMNNDLYPLIRRGHASLYARQRGINRLLGGGLDDPAWMRQRGLAAPAYGVHLGRLEGPQAGPLWIISTPPAAGTALNIGPFPTPPTTSAHP